MSAENSEQIASGSGTSEEKNEMVDEATRAEQLKEEGNTAFREKLYASAVDLYSQAISMYYY